ncbi:MAG TPA: beta-galactosidase, partial [Acidobacteriota bacterium]|nr:beta-galactosidase [Acidobacteriota bacterium]
PLWSGMGSPEQERPGMEDTRAFARLLHAAGMRVGVYIHNMNLSKGFLEAKPEAWDWLAWPEPKSNFTSPPPPESEGYPVYRNHPAYLAYIKTIVDFALREVKADLLHFDNFVNPAGWSPAALGDFQRYLDARYGGALLQEVFGTKEASQIAEQARSGNRPAELEWKRFQSWALADAYRQLAEYARSIRPDVAVELNASGIWVGFRHWDKEAIDLSQLLPHGDAFWDEQAETGWEPDKKLLKTAIRSYKAARLFHQTAFMYNNSRSNAHEALAFNYDGLGCLYWFMYGDFGSEHFKNPPLESEQSIIPETRFYSENRSIYAGGETIADVAVLRSSSTNLDGPPLSQRGELPEPIRNVYLFEQALITEHIPFTLVFDQHLDELSRYRALVLADVRMLSDAQVRKILSYVKAGGNLIVTGKTATEDIWGRPASSPDRKLFDRPGSSDQVSLGKGRIAWADIAKPASFENGSLPENAAELGSRIVELIGGPSIKAWAPAHVAAEYIKQGNEILVHLIDYSKEGKCGPVRITVSPRVGVPRTASLLGPRISTRGLAVRRTPGFSEVTCDSFEQYCVVKIELD